MILSVTGWLESHMLSCPYKKYLGIDCPGCGLQRSFIELLKGNFMESLKLYPALLPLILTLIMLALHLVFKYRNGASYVKWSFIFTVTVIVISFAFKFI